MVPAVGHHREQRVGAAEAPEERDPHPHAVGRRQVLPLADVPHVLDRGRRGRAARPSGVDVVPGGVEDVGHVVRRRPRAGRRRSPRRGTSRPRAPRASSKARSAARRALVARDHHAAQLRAGAPSPGRPARPARRGSPGRRSAAIVIRVAASQWASTYSSSRGRDHVLIGTSVAPSIVTAKSISSHSGRLVMSSATRRPRRTPSRRSPLASRRARAPRLRVAEPLAGPRR